MTKHQAQPYEQAAYKIRVGEWQRKGRGGVLPPPAALISAASPLPAMHGWLWLVAAFVGSVLGTYLRPWFGLSVEGNLAGAQAGPTARD